MWFAIHCETEELAQCFRKRLSQAEINAESPTLSLGGAAFTSVTFPEECRHDALEVLGIAEPVPSTPTDDSRFKLLLPQKVLSLLGPGESASAVRATLMPYAEELNLRIVATNAQGGCVSPHNDVDVLRLHFYAFPAVQAPNGIQPQAQYTQLASAFGVSLPVGVCNGLQPSGLGRPLIAPDEGITVAEVVNDSLYVLFSLTYPCPGSSDVIRSILAPLMELYLDACRPRAAAEGDARTQYAQACGRRLRLRRALLESKVNELGQEIARTGQSLVEKTRERRRVLDELEGFKHRSGALQASFEAEYETLRNSPHIKRVEVQSAYIHISLDGILIRYAGKSYCLGPYRMQIPLDGGRVRIQSEQPKPHSDGRLYHHPHVWGPEGDQICYGSIAADVPALLAEREFATAIDMLIAFLHEANDEEQRAQEVLQDLWKPLDRPRPCACEAVEQDARKEL